MALGTTKNGVDQTVAATVSFESSAAAMGTGVLQFVVTGESNTEERMLITGTSGFISVSGPHHCPTKVTLSLDQGRQSPRKVSEFAFPLPNDDFATWYYPGSIGFVYEIDEVARCLRAGLLQSNCFSHEESVVTAGLIETIKAQVLK